MTQNVVPIFVYNDSYLKETILLINHKFMKTTKSQWDSNQVILSQENPEPKKDPLSLLKEAFSFWCTPKEACLHAQITEQKYKQIIEENNGIEEQLNQLKLTPILEARKSLLEWIKSTPKIAFDYIKAVLPDEFWEDQGKENSWPDISYEQVIRMYQLIKSEDEFKEKLMDINSN